MTSRKQKKREQKKQARQRKARALRQRFERGEVIVLPEGVEKMSEVLKDFIEPYADFWKTEEELNKFLFVASIAWNAALLHGDERDKLLQDTLRTVPPQARPDLSTMLTELIRRKEIHFASNERIILSHEVIMGPDGLRLNVLSTFAGA